jgi:DNA excision repair protein ERCC-4
VTTTVEGAVNQAPQELLRSLPGVTSKNVRYLAQRVRNMEELVAMEPAEVEKLIGVEAGRQLVGFLTKDARQEL